MYRSLGNIHVKCYVRMYLVLVFFRKDSMKVNMDKIRQYEGSRKKYVHVYLSFRCIFLICSCHLSNHPSILWTILYPSPDDGYYNRNVNVDFTSWYIHLFGLYFFQLPSYCRISSIFTFIYIYVISPLLKHIQSQCTCQYSYSILNSLFKGISTFMGFIFGRIAWQTYPSKRTKNGSV